MARRGQVGTIAVSGKWYVVRFWKYPTGQDRVHASERVCPVDPTQPGYLSKGERRRRANEIVEASGVNDAPQFVETNVGTTFREQAKLFLDYSVNRKRRPIKPATWTNWEHCLDKWLDPNIGDLPLAMVHNATVKTLVANMHAAGLSAKTINSYVGLVKLVVASAIDQTGEQIFPRTWNHIFMDVPVIENQHRPTFTEAEMNSIVEMADGQARVLYALLAGSGLRMGEAFGLEVKHLSADCRTITVEQSCWEGAIQTPKTKAAYRQIDVCMTLANLLKEFVSGRTGLIFANSLGKPLSKTNALRRGLHPVLVELGIEKTGFHAMRRFRATWLRKQRTPEDLIRFWLGHAASSVTDGYSKLSEDREYRRDVAEKIGLGFTISTSLIPMRPRIAKKKQQEIVA